jgi:hypothetical protein
MSLFRFFMGIGTIRIDSPSNRQSRADKRKLENEREAWYNQAERVTPEDADRFVPEQPLIHTTESDDIGEIIYVTFSRTTKGGYAPFIAHQNPDGSFDKTPIPKPATFDITEAFYVVSAYYGGMPLKDLPGEKVPLRLLSTGKWRFDIERMVDELKVAARNSPDWNLPQLATPNPPLKSHIENVEKATNDLTETLAEAREAVDYAILAMKSVATPEDVLNEYDKLLAGVRAEDDDVRQHAYGALAALADEYPDRISEDRDILFVGLHDDTVAVRKNALHALGNVAESRPDRVAPGREAIRDQIKSNDQAVATYAMETLSLVSGSNPGAEDWIERLESVLANPEDDIILTAATRTAALLAEITPITAGQLSPLLEGYLDHEDSDVRENACMYFQFLGVESVEPKLRERLEDSDANVQRAASAALDSVQE